MRRTKFHSDLYKAAQIVLEKCVIGKSPSIVGQMNIVGKFEFPEGKIRS